MPTNKVHLNDGGEALVRRLSWRSGTLMKGMAQILTVLPNFATPKPNVSKLSGTCREICCRRI